MSLLPSLHVPRSAQYGSAHAGLIMTATPRRTLDTRALIAAVDRKRKRHKLTWRQAMVQITGSYSASLKTRMEAGQPISGDMLGAIMIWLGSTDMKPYLLPFTKNRFRVVSGGEAGRIPGQGRAG